MMGSPAQDADLAFIAACIARARLDPENLRVEQFTVWRAGADTPVVAFGRIKPYGDGVFELGSVFVDEAQRGSGLGERVVRDLMRRFPTPDVYITTDLAGYFARFGFVPIAAADTPAAIAGKVARVCSTLREGVVAMRAPRPNDEW